MATAAYYGSSPGDTRSSPFFSQLFAALTRTHGKPNEGAPTKQQLEYLFEEAYTSTGPSWGARICYGTGLTYLTFLSLGGLWGAVASLNQPLSFKLAPGQQVSGKLRMNAVLNGITSRGPFMANTGSMLALLYNLVHGAVIRLRDGRYDAASSVVSAAAAGAIFKSTAGWRSAGRAAGIFGLGMLVYRVLDASIEEHQRRRY